MQPRSKTRLRSTLARELSGQLMEFILSEDCEKLKEHPLLKLEIRSVTLPLSRYMNETYEPIETSAESFFRDLYKKLGHDVLSIRFSPKRSGVHLGRMMHLTYFPKNAETSRIEMGTDGGGGGGGEGGGGGGGGGGETPEDLTIESKIPNCSPCSGSPPNRQQESMTRYRVSSYSIFKKFPPPPKRLSMPLCGLYRLSR